MAKFWENFVNILTLSSGHTIITTQNSCGVYNIHSREKYLHKIRKKTFLRPSISWACLGLDIVHLSKKIESFFCFEWPENVFRKKLLPFRDKKILFWKGATLWKVLMRQQPRCCFLNLLDLFFMLSLVLVCDPSSIAQSLRWFKHSLYLA